MAELDFHFATAADSLLLAEMNQQLIQDEGHRNPMTLVQLEQRMSDFLNGDYKAVLFSHSSKHVGYALFRVEPEFVYLRQFFVAAPFRRRGVGRTAIDWLRQHAWSNSLRIRLDVLIGNAGGLAFWRAVGFADYCLTLELPLCSAS